MKEYYIGLDVHKDSVLMAVLDDRKVRSTDKADSDVMGTWEVPANSPQLIKAIRQYQETGKIFVAYEAGCLGFDVYHFLGKHGIACEIIPANTVFWTLPQLVDTKISGKYTRRREKDGKERQ